MEQAGPAWCLQLQERCTAAGFGGGNGTALLGGTEWCCLLAALAAGEFAGGHEPPGRSPRRRGGGGRALSGPCKGRPGASWFRDAKASCFRPGYCPAGTFPGKRSGQGDGGSLGALDFAEFQGFGTLTPPAEASLNAGNRRCAVMARPIGRAGRGVKGPPACRRAGNTRRSIGRRFPASTDTGRVIK